MKVIVGGYLFDCLHLAVFAHFIDSTTGLDAVPVYVDLDLTGFAGDMDAFRTLVVNTIVQWGTENNFPVESTDIFFPWETSNLLNPA